MKKFRVDGSVDRLKKEDVTKRETEGVGENKISHTVETEQHTAVIVGGDGQRVRITQDDDFDFIVGEVVSVTVEYGKQTRLDDDGGHPVPKKKA